MTRWTRTVVLPVAVAIPLLGIGDELLNPLLTGHSSPPPWRKSSSVVWLSWGFMVPLLLALEERWPLNRLRWKTLLVHLGAFALVMGSHVAFAVWLNAATAGDLTRYVFFDRIPRYIPLDLLV